MSKKRLFIPIFLVIVLCASLFCIPASAEKYPQVYILDYAGLISPEDEETINTKAREVAKSSGFNIVIVTTDDIGTPKTDAHVIEYADDKYEEYCGINTDGILLLLNNDTKYDWVSTSGSCINYFSDDRIEALWPRLDEPLKEENYAQAAYNFVFYIEKCYAAGAANDQQEFLGVEVSPSVFFATFIRLGGMSLLVGAVLYFVFAKQYKMQKPGTRNYVVQNSLVFSEKADVYVGMVTTRTYSPRSSSSGSHHSSGGHHHSSTHHSHSGGRHGGGGHHR